MDFGLPDERRLIREEGRRFAENEIEPIAREYDVEEKFSHGVHEKAAEMGLSGPCIPIEYGGAGYVNDFPVQRFDRDAKIIQIDEKPTEIRKDIVARESLEEGLRANPESLVGAIFAVISDRVVCHPVVHLERILCPLRGRNYGAFDGTDYRPTGKSRSHWVLQRRPPHESGVVSEPLEGTVPETIHRISNPLVPGVLFVHDSGARPLDRRVRRPVEEGLVCATTQCFGDVGGVPNDPVEVPLETIDRLATHEAVVGDRIGLYGGSKGGELPSVRRSVRRDRGGRERHWKLLRAGRIPIPNATAETKTAVHSGPAHGVDRSRPDPRTRPTARQQPNATVRGVGWNGRRPPKVVGDGKI